MLGPTRRYGQAGSACRPHPCRARSATARGTCPQRRKTMKWTLCAVGLAGLCLTWPATAPAGARQCPPDSVEVGSACVDRYEASVWQIAPSNTSLVEKVLAEHSTPADLTS